MIEKKKKRQRKIVSGDLSELSSSRYSILDFPGGDKINIKHQTNYYEIPFITHLRFHPISALRHSNIPSPAAPLATRYFDKPRTTSATSSFERPWTAVSITPPTLA